MIGLATSCCFNHHSNKQICTPALVQGGGCWKSSFLAFYVTKKMLLESFFSKQKLSCLDVFADSKFVS